MVAAVTGDDEDNLVISLLAKQEFAVPRVVARVNNPKNEWMFNEMWGVDVSVSTPHLLTALVEEAVSVGSLVRLLSFEGGRARLSEATLAADSPADGKDIAELGLPRDSTVVAIIRDGPRDRPPRRHACCAAGDEVLVLTTPDAEDDVVTHPPGLTPAADAEPTRSAGAAARGLLGLVVELVDEVLGLLGRGVDLVGVLAAGLVVDHVGRLVDGLGGLVALAARAAPLILSMKPICSLLGAVASVAGTSAAR